jgi:ectoine hydroxylase-related dioxygenase (phytanoyl-CoA dioxygenase family)
MQNLLSAIDDELSHPYSLSGEQIDFYRRHEYIKLKQVLSPGLIAHFARFIHAKTHELNTNTKPMAERDTYAKAFIQVCNLWRHCDQVRRFVFQSRLARIAAELMEVSGVRLYHDQALFKESGGGITPWHADQQYWPLASNKTITAWIPLQAVTLDMGPLAFAAGSQLDHRFRQLAISDDSERLIQAAMSGYPLDCGSFELGEVSFHSGWMYHRAPPNQSPHSRGVMTVIYMDENMLLKEPESANQINDRDAFCPGVAIGELCASPLNPILWSRS